MKYLKPEMDIVEFDESVLTTGDITVSGNDSTEKDNGNAEMPEI